MPLATLRTPFDIRPASLHGPGIATVIPKLVNRIQMAAALEAIGTLIGFALWWTPDTPYRLVRRRWFLNTMGPAKQKELAAMKVSRNLAVPAWNCYFQAYQALLLAKRRNYRVGGPSHNVAIGAIGFQNSTNPPGHVAIVAFTEKCEPVFWNLNTGQEYDPSINELRECEFLSI